MLPRVPYSLQERKQLRLELSLKWSVRELVYACQSMLLLLICGFCSQTPSVDSGVASHLTSMLPSESEGMSLMHIHVHV